MSILNNKLASVMALGAMIGIFSAVDAAAAERVVWDENGVGKTPPQIIYSYKYGAGSMVDLDTAEIDGAPYYMEASFSVNGKTSDFGAGFGFSWNATQDADYSLTSRVTDISGFGGVCLTYSSTNIVRMDFRQADISSDNGGDDNFFGTWLASTDGASKNTFVAFDDLKMGWSGSWKLNKKKQLGLQFSYKGEKVNKYGSESSIKITALRLADECPSHAPEVNPYNPTKYELKEGEVLSFKMSDVFRDLDGDELTITATFSGTGVNTSFDDTKPITLDSTITFTTVTNPAPTDSFEMKFVAVDPTGKKADWTIGIKPIDEAHVPTIKDSTFEVLQGEKISFSKTYSFYGTLAYDLDGDEFDLYLYEEPETGTFSFDAKNGRFTYEAPSDFSGDVYFSLYAIEQENEESVSDTVRFKIHVIDINDPPTVDIVNNEFDYYVGDLDADALTGTFNDSAEVIKVDEDFEDTIWVEIDPKNVVFDDVDSEIKMGVKTNGVVNAKIVTFGRTNYIEITSKENANGFASVTYYADDGEYKVGVNLFLSVKAVDDPPIANDDEYDAVQDSTIKVAVAKGLLVNDVNPDDEDAELTVKIKTKPKYGKLTLSEDGSFKYVADSLYRGDVTFTYICINDLDVESEPATVTIHVAAKNMAPVANKDLVDSLEKVLSALEEDKVLSSKTFKFTAIETWFEDPDGEPLTFTAENEDGKLTITTSKSSITVGPAADSCGASEVIFIATDSSGASAKLVVPVYIKPANDAPVGPKAEDLKFKVDVSDWEMVFDLDTLITDIDGDTLSYSITKATTQLKEYFVIQIEGSKLTISPHKTLEGEKDYTITIEGSDGKAKAQAIFTFTTGKAKAGSKDDKEDSKGDSIKRLANLKTNWQAAISETNGFVSIMDMQGRVMWTAKLPVNEADVRRASASVQGRKVMRVNSQTYTIK